MKKQLYFVGAGDFSREVLLWTQEVIAQQADYEIVGFLDDNREALKGYPNLGFQVVGSISDHRPSADQVFVMAIASPAAKLKVGRLLSEKGAKFINVIHPRALVAPSATLGTGCVVGPNCVISCDAKIGNFVSFVICAAAGHDCQIGDGCTLSSFVDVTGFVRLGRGVFLGSRASLLPHVEVGDGARIGAGSVVVTKVKPGVTVFGVPAKRVG